MSDVGKISGSGEKSGPSGPKRKKETDPEAFREMMKVGKAREVDPEEKRKRKRREEAEEEMVADQTAATPPQQGAPEVEEGDGLTFQAPSSAGGAAAAPPPSQTPPSYEPGEEGSIYYEDTQPAQQSQQSQRSKKKRKTEKSAKKKEVFPPTPPKKLAHPKKGKMAKGAPPIAPKIAPDVPPAKKGAIKPEIPPKKQHLEKKKEAPPVQTELPEPLPKGGWESTKHTDEEEKIASPEQTIAPEAMQNSPLQIEMPVPSSTAPPHFISLPAQILNIQLFDRMVGVMTVMKATGKTETTISLTAPQYKNSIFFGSEITITEFSTAPKDFNIELKGSPEAATLFKGNAEELVAAFQAGNYTFKVGRVDASILHGTPAAEKKKKIPPVKRKKGA